MNLSNGRTMTDDELFITNKLLSITEKRQIFFPGDLKEISLREDKA